MGSARGWTDEFCSYLADQGFFVIRFDHRDTGLSSSIDYAKNPYWLDDMVEDILAILNTYKIDKAHLVGKPYSAFHVADLVIQAANQGSKIKDSTSRRNFLMDLLTNNQIKLQDSIFPLKKKTK